jgi:hypothetical protein
MLNRLFRLNRVAKRPYAFGLATDQGRKGGLKNKMVNRPFQLNRVAKMALCFSV